MKYWQNIKERLENHWQLTEQLLMLFAFIYIVVLANDFKIWKLCILFSGFLVWFLIGKNAKHPISWIVILLLLIIDLVGSYFWVANHHFLLLFVVLSMVFYGYHQSNVILYKNVQALLIIVLCASVIHKLFSYQFISGNFYYHSINQGTIFKSLFYFFPDSLEIANSNAESIKELNETDPNLLGKIKLVDVFPNLRIITIVFAWMTIIVEFLAAVALLSKPKSKWTHLVLIAMILGILFTKLETGFMSLLSICGLLLCNHLKLKIVYLIVAIACLTMIITKIGYH
ncbi:hypothetical protein [uncultured Winogradskyella sp.]|uniref:hypothetical protein n=1 Tax=Winogradskyella sp. 4-2091 TaxID=3381659 RepID=UPI00261F417B|nr:hypothetical protein [uncultured Winogradskyella sp.]